MEIKNILYCGCIWFCMLSLFGPNWIIKSVVAQTGANITTTTVGTTPAPAGLATTTTAPPASIATTTTTAAPAGLATTTTTVRPPSSLAVTTVAPPASLATTTAAPTTGLATTPTTAPPSSPATTTTTTAPPASLATTTTTTAAPTTTTTTTTAAPITTTTTTPEVETTTSPTTTTDLPTTTAGDPQTTNGLLAVTDDPTSTIVDVPLPTTSAGNPVDETIQPSTFGISEPTTDSSTPAAPTTGYPTQIDQIIHIKVQEIQKSADKAEKELNQMSLKSDGQIVTRMKLNDIEGNVDAAVFQETNMLREVENTMFNLKIIEKELDIKEHGLMLLNGHQTLLEHKIEEDLKLNKSSTVAFFAQRNNGFQKTKHPSIIIHPFEIIGLRTISFHLAAIIHPFEIISLNEGQCFNGTSGIFTAPFNGIYHFFFTGLKMKRQTFGTGRVTLQIVKNTKILPTDRKVLAETHMDSAWNWYGWFGLQLQVTAELKANDEVTVELIEGSIYESVDPEHHLTSFGGFLISRL